MKRPSLAVFAGGLVLFGASTLALNRERAQRPSFDVVEATIGQIHDAFRARRLTCRALVESYLKRIDAYDQQGPSLNAIVVVNPKALETADELDRQFASRGLTGPLHCVPTIVKDNFETIGLQSAGGSITLKGFVSDKDAFQVKRIRAAGAIVIAKSNMGEFAFSPLETVNSLIGTTRNPYALDRVPAGSSGGTAAAVAASFGAVGLGSDTGNSIRGPSAHAALAGIRSTMGLTSRGGVIPLSYLADVAGPMARTVEDMTRVFQAVVGEDPADPVTARSRGRTIPDYSKALVRDGLKGARIGVLRDAIRGTLDDEVAQVFAKALADLKTAGAEIIDPTPVDRTGVQRAQGAGGCRGFKYDLNEYLAAQGDRVPVRNLDAILAHPDFAKIPAPSQQRLRSQQNASMNGPDTEACKAEMAYRAAFGAAVTKTMDDQKLDAFVYPTWSQPPQLIGQTNQQSAGDNSQVFSPSSGFPALSVPMGYTRDGQLPAGITFFGRAWSEETLIKLAYAYEQATKHRKPPPTTPAIR